MRKIIIAGCLALMFSCVYVFGDTSKMGQIRSKIQTIIGSGTSTSVTLDGSTSDILTGTITTQHDIGFFSIEYQVTQGTSTPHYFIDYLGSYDGENFTTQPLGTLTASTDTTSTDRTIVQFNPPPVAYIQIRVHSATGNATDTSVIVKSFNQ